MKRMSSSERSHDSANTPWEPSVCVIHLSREDGEAFVTHKNSPVRVMIEKMWSLVLPVRHRCPMPVQRLNFLRKLLCFWTGVCWSLNLADLVDRPAALQFLHQHFPCAHTEMCGAHACVPHIPSHRFPILLSASDERSSDHGITLQVPKLKSPCLPLEQSSIYVQPVGYLPSSDQSF